MESKFVFIILAIATATVFFPAASPAMANHLILYKWSQNPAIVYYCISTDLGQLNIGYTNAKAEIRAVAAEINALPYTDWVLYQVAYDSNCKNKIHMGNIPQTGVMAQVVWTIKTPCTPQCQLVSIDLTIDTDFKNKYDMGSCVNGNPSYTGPYRLKNLMRHEFGHWAALKHSSSFSDLTVMWFDYRCDRWQQYWPNDKATFKSMYPQEVSTASMPNSMSIQSATEMQAAEQEKRQVKEHFNTKKVSEYDMAGPRQQHEGGDEEKQIPDKIKELREKREQHNQEILKQRCLNMKLGDNHTEGYIERLAEYCLTKK